MTTKERVEKAMRLQEAIDKLGNEINEVHTMYASISGTDKTVIVRIGEYGTTACVGQELLKTIYTAMEVQLRALGAELSAMFMKNEAPSKNVVKDLLVDIACIKTDLRKTISIMDRDGVDTMLHDIIKQLDDLIVRCS